MEHLSESGIVIGSVIGFGLYEFFKLPDEVQAQLCCAIPILGVAGIAVFLFLRKETLRMSRGR